jgi:hypothetical protein
MTIELDTREQRAEVLRPGGLCQPLCPARMKHEAESERLILLDASFASHARLQRLNHLTN